MDASLSLERRKLRPQLASLLSCFVDHPGRSFPHDDLLRMVWSSGGRPAKSDVMVAVSSLNKVLRTRQGGRLDTGIGVVNEKDKGYRLDATVVTFNPSDSRVDDAPPVETNVLFARRHFEHPGEPVELREIASVGPDGTAVLVGFAEEANEVVVDELVRRAIEGSVVPNDRRWRTVETGARVELRLGSRGNASRPVRDADDMVMEYLALAPSPDGRAAWWISGDGFVCEDSMILSEKDCSSAYVVRAALREFHGDPTGALRDARAAVRRAGNDAELAWGYFVAGDILRNLGEAVEGQQAYEEAVVADTGGYLPSFAYESIGRARDLAGEHEAAVSAYSEALEREADPSARALVQCHRGGARHTVGDHAGSMRDYREALAMADEGTTAHVVLMMVKTTLGEGVGLATVADIGRQPMLVSAASGLAATIAVLLGGGGDHPEERQVSGSRHAARRVERSAKASVHVLRGCVHEDRGDLDAALVEYETANRHVETTVAYAQRARCDWTKRRYRRSVEAYEASARCSLANARAARRLLSRGLARQEGGDHAGALRDLAWAIDRGLVGVDQARAHLGAAQALAARGERSRAAARLGIAVQCAPDTAGGRTIAGEAYGARAALRAGLGDSAGAVEDYGKARASWRRARGSTTGWMLLPDEEAELEFDTAAEQATHRCVYAAVLIARGRLRAMLAPEKALEDYRAAVAAATDDPGLVAAAHAGTVATALISGAAETAAAGSEALARLGLDREALVAVGDFGKTLRVG